MFMFLLKVKIMCDVLYHRTFPAGCDELAIANILIRLDESAEKHDLVTNCNLTSVVKAACT